MGDAIDYNQRSRTNLGELIMETLEVRFPHPLCRSSIFPPLAIEACVCLHNTFPHLEMRTCVV